MSPRTELPTAERALLTDQHVSTQHALPRVALSGEGSIRSFSPEKAAPPSLSGEKESTAAVARRRRFGAVPALVGAGPQVTMARATTISWRVRVLVGAPLGAPCSGPASLRRLGGHQNLPAVRALSPSPPRAGPSPRAQRAARPAGRVPSRFFC
eukprot:COSAG06_NODE_46_length_29282_cov_16.235770_3_plen_154_part_00